MRVLLLVALVALVGVASALPVAHTQRSFVEAESTADACLTTKRGVCLDSRTSQCSTTFVSGLCPGAAHIKCCPAPTAAPATAPAATTTTFTSSNINKCVTAGGECLHSGTNKCATGFQSGLCPGAAAIKCCPKATAAPATTTTTTTTVTPAPATPVSSSIQFSKLAQCYPQGEAEDVKKRIGGAINAAWITNTCAIRMSNTLNCAGKVVPQSGGESIRSANGWNHIFRVKQLSPLIKKWFGNGVTYKAPTGRGVPLASLKGKKGIIYFDTTGAWSDATGHFDLWDGSLMVESSHANQETVERYFSLAVSITLWQFQ